VRDNSRFREIFGSKADRINIINSLEKQNCDYLIHTISPTASKFFINNPVETIKASVFSLIDALDFAKESQATVLYLSSMEEYGIPYVDNQTITENDIGIINHLDVRSSYSESKRLCECLCVSYAKEYNMDIKIARLAQTFGTLIRDNDNRMPLQFARAAAGKNNIELHTKGQGLINFVYMTDAIIGLLAILFNGESGEAYNVCNDQETLSVYDIARLVADEIVKDIDVDVKIPKESMGYAPPVKMKLDSTKLKNLGWRPSVGQKEGYARVIECLSNN
jgi:nucleoside-diphosphate-sugar epimerase